MICNKCIHRGVCKMETTSKVFCGNYLKGNPSKEEWVSIEEKLPDNPLEHVVAVTSEGEVFGGVSYLEGLKWYTGITEEDSKKIVGWKKYPKMNEKQLTTIPRYTII